MNIYTRLHTIGSITLRPLSLARPRRRQHGVQHDAGRDGHVERVHRVVSTHYATLQGLRSIPAACSLTTRRMTDRPALDAHHAVARASHVRPQTGTLCELKKSGAVSPLIAHTKMVKRNYAPLPTTTTVGLSTFTSVTASASALLSVPNTSHPSSTHLARNRGITPTDRTSMRSNAPDEALDATGDKGA